MMQKRVLKHNISLLNVDYVKLDSKWNYENIISPYHRIYYIDDGEGEISDRENKLKLEAGFLYIIPSYTLCNLTCKSYLSQYFVQFFEESPDGSSLFSNARSIYKVKADEIDVLNFKRLVEINPGRGINRSSNPKIYEKNAYYKEYQNLNNYQTQPHFLQTQGILLQLISRFPICQVVQQVKPEVLPAKVLDAMQFVLVNLHLPLSVKQLADRANLNPQYFSRLFAEHTGIRPQAYIIEKRIERAQHIILTGTSTLAEVSALTGFNSLSDFSRTFKKQTGIAPRYYKRPPAIDPEPTGSGR